MEALYELINNNISFAPYIIFGLLLLAGFNIPISEDGMLFISAVLAKNNPDLLIPLFIAVYLGAYFSDLICFSLGWFLGPKILKIKFFSSIVTEKRRLKIHSYYERYGIITLILGRFIPFGVRNGLFMTAGLGKMHPVKFMLSDIFACTLSSISIFYLYYTYGSVIIDYIKKGNIVIISLFVTSILIYLFFIKNRKK